MDQHMDQQERLAQQFEQHRPRLRAVAYRMLGSLGEAEDAVQDAWLRLSRSDGEEIGSRVVRGAETVARQASGWSRGHRNLTIHRALVNGAAGMVSLRDGRPFSLAALTVRGDRIVEVRARALADQWMDRLARDRDSVILHMEFIAHAGRDPELAERFGSRSPAPARMSRPFAR